jgi:DNA-binding NarL/FixJ family response regulator
VSCRIVICDDQPAFRQLLSVVLGIEPGFLVVGEASDGLQAIDVVRRERPDIVLLDIAMPKLDGLEALPQIRAASPSSRVVMLTAFGSDVMRERATAGGATHFIEKGGDMDDLVADIREACAAD